MIPFNMLTPGPSGLAGLSGLAPPTGGGTATRKASLLADGFGAAQFQQFLDTALKWDDPQPVQPSEASSDRQSEDREVKESSRSERSRPEKSESAKAQEQVDPLQVVEAPLLETGTETAEVQVMANPLTEAKGPVQAATQETMQDPALRNDAWQMAVVVAQWSVTTQNQTVTPQQQLKPMTTGVVQNSVSDLALAVYLQKGAGVDQTSQFPLEALAEVGERVEVSLNDLTALVSGRGAPPPMEGLTPMAPAGLSAPQPAAQPMMMAAMLQASPLEQLAPQALKADSPLNADSIAGPSGSTPTANAKGAAATPTLSTRSPQFAAELAEQVGKLKIYSRPGQSEQVRLSLDPQDLGAINMKLKVDADNKVHLIISTESEATKELLTKQIGQLKEALAKGHMGLGEVTVHVGGEESGRNASSGQWAQHRSGGEPGSGGGRASRESDAPEKVAPVTPPPSANRVGDDGVSLVA
ncbi:MAG: flagellar hook-length control protein FliK [Magnetococcales bacterium]|nr:flagellar hook-length control protein FliK [Magnetococcales bacterium]